MIALWDFLRTLSIRLQRCGLLSMLLGGLLLVSGEVFWQGFGLQMLGWGAVEETIAIVVWRSIACREATLMSWEQVSAETSKLERRLWASVALGALYIIGGITVLLENGAESLFWSGGGWGIFAQGVFLSFFAAYHARQLARECLEI